MLSFVITLKETKVLISFRNQSLPVQHVLVSIGVFNRQLVKLHQLLFNKDKLGCPTNTRIRILLHTYCDKQPVENGAAIHMFSIAFWHRFGSRFRRENPLIPAPWGRNRKSLIPENWKGFLPIALQFGKEELIKLVRFHLEFKSGQDNDLSNNLHLLHGNDVSCIVAHFIQNAFLPAEEE